ncbi:MAG: DNA helicase II, partial [Proteobacteria bacterium]|nr:DNA helicase II [Pseudomonadota bacterium]
RVYGRWLSASPSRFIDELPPEHTVRTSVPGQYGQGLADRGARFLSRADDGGGEAGGEAHAFAIGQRIFHQKFGYGAITAIDGPKLNIRFDKAGPKKVMARFVEGA